MVVPLVSMDVTVAIEVMLGKSTQVKQDVQEQRGISSVHSFPSQIHCLTLIVLFQLQIPFLILM